MKYILNDFEYPNKTVRTVTITADEINFVSFPAEIGNPNYDAFLIQVGLTDEEVHALPVDEWIEA